MTLIFVRTIIFVRSKLKYIRNIEFDTNFNLISNFTSLRIIKNLSFKELIRQNFIAKLLTNDWHNSWNISPQNSIYFSLSLFLDQILSLPLIFIPPNFSYELFLVIRRNHPVHPNQQRSGGIKRSLLCFASNSRSRSAVQEFRIQWRGTANCANGEALDHCACIRLPKWRAIRKTVMKVPVE